MIIADIVARAIVTACRELQTDPTKIVSGASDAKMSQTFPISRSRAYAAIALTYVIPEFGRPAIARMVGASSPDSYLSTLQRRIELKECPWFDEAVAARVRQATIGEAAGQ